MSGNAKYTVKKLMDKCGIAPSEAAMAMNCSRSLVYKYANETRPTPEDKLQMLAQYAAQKIAAGRAMHSIQANLEDRENEAAQMAGDAPARAIYWSSHSQQYDPATNICSWQPVPAPYPCAVPGATPSPHTPGMPDIPPCPHGNPPAGYVHLYDHDARAWVIEPEPA